MALNFTGKVESNLIKNGEYEVVLKVEWEKTMNGDKYMKCVYTIREDVEQEYVGRLVFDGIYCDEKGVYDERKINAILSTIENPKCDFEDYDEVVQYLNGKLLKIEIGAKTSGDKNKNVIKFWTAKPTNHPEYTHHIETVAGVINVSNQTEIEDEDLPF